MGGGVQPWLFVSGGCALVAIKREACDIWCSRVVRARDKTCMRCGTSDGLEAMHVYGRRSKILRWSLDNLISGCHACHRWYSENPIHFVNELTAQWGEGHMELLAEKARGHMKTNASLRKEIAAHYRAEYRKMEADPDYEPISYN